MKVNKNDLIIMQKAFSFTLSCGIGFSIGSSIPIKKTNPTMSSIELPGYNKSMEAENMFLSINSLEYFFTKNYNVFLSKNNQMVLSTKKHIDNWQNLGRYIPLKTDKVAYFAYYLGEGRYRYYPVTIEQLSSIKLGKNDYIGIYDYENFLNNKYNSNYGITGNICYSNSHLKIPDDKEMIMRLVRK